eukprot:CAMPEP_0167747572 /NCGR_PEP_ID=MMETSP0110_2-20121227/4359_1 /TAXON_ID=629695 /ORGANISM="Gymnochlora sp., Strain CCMP2014" /LENGTH=282 /DNA_ID=CAMNT_0007632495 /DNA_START=127 /DNA_END=972 /DNA_ORIENTATION=+
MRNSVFFIVIFFALHTSTFTPPPSNQNLCQKKSDATSQGDSQDRQGIPTLMRKGFLTMHGSATKGLGYADPTPAPTYQQSFLTGGLLKPPTEQLFIHIREPLTSPNAWNVTGDPLRLLFSSNKNSESGQAINVGPEKSKEELLAELRKLANRLLEDLSGPEKQTMKQALDKGLDHIKGLSKDQILRELKVVNDRLKDVNKFRLLRLSAWIHMERIIREGQALTADSPENAGPIRIPRLAPRTIREQFASTIVSLLHPYMDLDIKSDLLVERRSAWIPTPMVW